MSGFQGGGRKRDKLLSIGKQGIAVAADTAAAAASVAGISGAKKRSANEDIKGKMAEFQSKIERRAAAGRVNISRWNLYGRDTHENDRKPLQPGFESDAVFLVGPVVGTVTYTTGRVLVELSSRQTVTMEAFMDDESVCTVTKDVRARSPTVFQLEDFAPGKRIRVVVSAEGVDEVREARFMTPKEDKRHWKVAAVSCNCHIHTDKVGLWNKLSKVVGDVDCVLHLGDQVYGDSDFGTRESGEPFESAWHASLSLLEPLERQEWDEHQETVREFYRNCYRTTWNMPYVTQVLASTANYMICDDHEFTDDLGDEPEHSNPSSLAFYVATLAYQVYNEYQHQLLEDVDVADPEVKPFYAIKLSPKVGIFMTDNRVERSLHRAQGTKASWEDRGFMGPSQWNKVTDAFESDFADCDVVLFGTPTPLVFLSQTATGLAQKAIDDARGTWGHSNFETEQEALANLMTDWQSAQENRAVITLGGDVHMGGFTDSWHKGCDIPLHQMTASAIGNRPEGGMNPVREAAMRSAMHADERLFKFKTVHYEWIYGPNYGVLDITIKKDEAESPRPHVTMTLVPENGAPKVRNLQFGDSSIKIKHEDHSHASKVAHASAKIMHS